MKKPVPVDTYEHIRGYPARRCTECGKPSVFPICRFCRPPKLRLK